MNKGIYQNKFWGVALMGAYLIIEALEDIRNLIQNGLEIFRVSRNKLYAQVLLHFVLD